MAKRRKRKHRPSARYLLFANKTQPKSIIPTITKATKVSKTETKQVRDAIRKAFSEQQKASTPKPSNTYNSNKKKNRKEARQKRKEKKQKAKQLQQQRQIQQEEPTPPTLDYGERDEDYRSETPDIDDTNNYIEDLISMIHSVNEHIADTFGKWLAVAGAMTSELDKLEYWLEEALQLPYETKLTLCDTLEGNQYLEELQNIMHLQYYKEVENTIEAIADEIIQIIESVY